MPRAKSVVPGKARKKKTLHAAKGSFHGRRKLLRSAKENVLRGLQYAYRDRRQRKRLADNSFRQLPNRAESTQLDSPRFPNKYP